MSLPSEILAPSWINSGAVIAGGLDLLGLRLPVQFIGSTLLDGITTITPSVRYIALRAWLIHRYGRSGLPDSGQHFTDFAARIEAAIVLGNLLQNRAITGLIGTEKALKRLDADTPQVALSALVDTPAVTVYAGPSDQLRVTKLRDNAVPSLVIERGVPLAQVVDRRLSGIPLIKQLFARLDLEEVSVADLRELGAVARIDQIPDDERVLLLAAIVPDGPLPKERARIGTYASLLALAAKLRRRPTPSDLFNAACSVDRFGEPVLDRVADGWTTYCVRDAIAVTQEAVLAAVMNEILASPERGQSGVESDGMIAALMERVGEHASALRDLGLLADGQSVADLSFGELYARMEARLSVDRPPPPGIRRWTEDLNEPRLYNLALRSGAGALSLAVVAWILAELRVGETIRENERDDGSLSYQGKWRLGLRDVILPELERFRRENRSLRAVAAELAYRTVQQHLQIAWWRLQADPRRDVALLTVEGNRWFSRGKGFAAGQTAVRLQQALGWLGQLGLIDGSGVTADGSQVLQRALQVLSQGTAP